MADSDSDPDYLYANVRPSIKQTATMGESDDDNPGYDNATLQTVQSERFELKGFRHSTFPVDIDETEASKRCNLGDAEYHLNVDVYGISLQDPKTVIYTWPYKFIRRHGIGAGLFVIDVGRLAASGEGTFRFRTTTPVKLHAAVKAGMKGDSSQPSASSSVEDLYAKVNKPMRSASGTKTTQ